MSHAIEQLGGHTLRIIQDLGHFMRFATYAMTRLPIDLATPKRWRLVWPLLYLVGTKSIPVVMITGAFIGMVLAVEAYPQFAAIGQEARLGGMINISVLRQIGPVMTAVMLAGRVGGAFSAELGSMAVTEQIDALRVMATDPVEYLVTPRIVACLVMVPMMTILSDLLGIFGGWTITVGSYGVSNFEYWRFSAQFVWSWDILTGIGKSVLFGLAIGLISCYKGFNCGRGAQGVGRATTNAFVASFLAIIVLNFFLAKLANDLFILIYGPTVINVFS